MLGHAAAPQTLQKGKCTPATIRLLMTQVLVRAAIKARAVSRNLNPSAAQTELAPFCIAAHCTSPCLRFSFSCPLPPLPPFSHEHPPCLPLFSPTGALGIHFGHCLSRESRGKRGQEPPALTCSAGEGSWQRRVAGCFVVLSS